MTRRPRERVLVLGGNGFIGSHIVDALFASGRSVRVLAPQQELFRPPNEAVEYHFGRLEIGARLESALDGCQVVIDAVASAVPASANQSPASSISNAVGASAWLAELCRNAESVETLVYLSSGGTVYGRSPDRRPRSENDPFAPIGAYGAMKAGSELALAGVLAGSPIRSISLRVSNAYGERQNPNRPQGIVAVALSQLRAGQPLTLFGETTRDFIHASDVASAVVHVLDSDARGPINVGSGVGVSIASLLERLETIAGAKIGIMKEPARDFDVPHAVLDISRAQALGWTPTVDLDNGLRRTWKWFEQLTRDQPTSKSTPVGA